MTVNRLEDLHAFQLARAFKRAVYAIVKANAEAHRDWRYRDQLFDAVLSGPANIAEGFSRGSAGEKAQFFLYALGSMREARVRLEDGLERGYFTADRCREAFTLCDRAIGATVRFHASLQPFIKKTKSGRLSRRV
jgi:four helix bundle protein